MEGLPLEIAGDECIVRALKRKYHLTKSGKLRAAAFKPTQGSSRVSVMRYLMGPDFCKNKGVELFGSDYCGLGSLRANAIRNAGFDIEDKRDEYLGHAEIDIGIAVPKADTNEAQDPLINAKIVAATERLRGLCTHLPDPCPEEQGWRGDPICP